MRNRYTRWLGAFTAAATVAATALLTVPAHAGDAPPTPVGEFQAPMCQGTTWDDPRDQDPAEHEGETDLTRVFGARLDSYNRGNVVPLYDSYGWADDQAYPPLCATYYDPETNAPQSVWMFCTDVNSKVCGDLGPNGTLTEAGDDVGEMGDLPANPRLNKEQEQIIAWLLLNGYDYTPMPGETAGTVANQESSDNRFSLQNLIWCISDPDHPVAEFQAMCAENMTAADKAQILAQAPQEAEIDLGLSASGEPVVVGQVRRITVTTNVFQQPITLQAGGTATGDLSVCEGPGTLSGNQLTVNGTDPTQPVTVTLCLTPTSEGTYELEASAQVASSDYLQWAQSDDMCQVFARFRHDEPHQARAAVTFPVTPAPEPEPEPEPGPVTKSKPRLTTQASHQVARPGAKLYDTVKIKGFKKGHGATGKATLYGPLSTVDRNSCRPANKVGTVTFRPRNGTIRTPRIKVKAPGYYTWVARTTSDSRNKAASHRCGLKAETTLVRKKQYGVPVVDTGFVGPVAARGVGSSVRMPATDLDAGVVGVGLARGRMLVPGDIRTVGHLRASAGVGDKIGTAVLAGHVSDRSDRPGAMWGLRKASRGQVVTVRSGSTTQKYKVTKVERFSRSSRMPARLFNTAGAHRLVLISCSDKVVSGGRFHYTKNLVVTAVPVK